MVELFVEDLNHNSFSKKKLQFNKKLTCITPVFMYNMIMKPM